MVRGRPAVLSLVLAGGEGSRLAPLTRLRAKPAVPFGGVYRLVDFVLSNLANGGFRRIAVLTQYKSHSLDRHLALTWRMSTMLGNFVAAVPAQMRQGPRWFEGSADAIFQNLNIIDDDQPDYVLVFGADHVYRMDPRQMLDEHLARGAGVTVAATRVPVAEASGLGVIDADESGRIREFVEKPADPSPYADADGQVLVSMGNYSFSAMLLKEAVRFDARNERSGHDVGGDLIPALVARGEASVYDFSHHLAPGQSERERGYWRDVGTIDAFHDAHMELVGEDPPFNLGNPEWPIYSYVPPVPPARLLRGDLPPSVVDSLLSPGVLVTSASVDRSVLSTGVVIEEHARVEDSVLMPGVWVGPGAVVRQAIIDKDVVVPPGVKIGMDPERDRARFARSAGGIIAIGKGDVITS